MHQCPTVDLTYTQTNLNPFNNTDIQDDNILLELTDAVYQQDDKLMKIEQENAILNATFSKLQAELREGGDHAANELLNPEPQTKTMKQTERAARLGKGILFTKEYN